LKTPEDGGCRNTFPAVTKSCIWHSDAI